MGARSFSSRTWAAIFAVLASACAGNADDDAADPPGGLAEDGSDLNAAETDIALVTSTLVSGTNETTATRSIGDGARAVYFPRGCLTVTRDDATQTVTYGFAGCAGPNGLFRVTGEVKATYRAAPGRMTLELVATGLTVNRAHLDGAATADITAVGPTREMHWKGKLTGTTPRGRSFTRTSDKVLTWKFGERCFAISGTSSGTVRDREIRAEIFDFKRCQLACPEAGGRIVLTNLARGKTITISFDGTNRASYTGPNGENARIPLACQG